MGRELTAWDALATEVVVDHRSYRLRRAELHDLGRFEPDPTKNTNVTVSFLGRGAELAGAREEIELLLCARGELKAAIRAGAISSAGTVATISRTLEEL